MIFASGCVITFLPLVEGNDASNIEKQKQKQKLFKEKK
jgi:predicted aconitase with swiveling domain